METKKLNDKIIEVASDLVGKKEIPGNLGFEDEEFEKELTVECGWQKGQAWCAYFAELVYKKAFPANMKKTLDLLFSAGAVATFNNFRRLGAVSKEPVAGALVVWQTYKDSKPHWTGHIGIVEKVEKKHIVTIEGNTNSKGGREGLEVARKERPIDFKIKAYGLVLKGFVNPDAVKI